MQTAADYEQDFYAWALDQANALRGARPNAFDWEHIAEELEAMGRSERREMESRVRQILKHLLKWQFQPWQQTRSWRHTLTVQRRDLDKLLRRNPSLRPLVAQAIDQEYSSAALEALNETGLPDGVLPDSNPYDAERLLDPHYLPA